MLRTLTSHRSARAAILAIGGALVVLGSTATGVAATPTPSPTARPTATPTATPKATPTATPRATPTATPAPAPPAGKPASNPTAPTRLAPVAGTTAPALPLPLPVVIPPILPATNNCPTVLGVVTCDLYAIPGTVTVPGMTAPLPVWGFSLNNSAGPGLVPGPTLVIVADLTSKTATLTVNLHNSLPAGAGCVSLEIAQSSATPDLVGVAPGGTSTCGTTSAHAPYSFSGLKPGTYVYEAGATNNGQRQVAMGLAGMLVVRPANFAVCRMAYDGSTAPACDGTPFTNEAPVQLNEFSSAFNTATSGGAATADLATYRPDVFLLNGKSFDSANPSAGSIAVTAGDRLFLRYANLGLRERSISIANARQQELASDGAILKVQHDIDAVYVNPVQTTDTLTLVDPTLPLGTQVPVYDQGHHMTTWGGTAAQPSPNRPLDGGGMGGMIAMLNVLNPGLGSPAAAQTSVTVSPKVNDLNPANPADVTCVDATITPTLGVVIGAEWFLDAIGAPGTGTPITHTACGTGGNYSFTLTVAQLQALLAPPATLPGAHVIWVEGRDLNGWGVASGDSFTLDLGGPLVTHVSVHSTPTNTARINDLDGTSDLDIVGSASAALSGWVVTAAEVCIDAPCSASLKPNPAYDQPGHPFGAFTGKFGLPLQTSATTTGVNSPDASIVGFSGAVPAGLLPTLEGTHTLFIHACEGPAILPTVVSNGQQATYTASTATDPSLSMPTTGLAGYTITTASGQTGTVASNTATTITLTPAGWTGGTPANGTAFTVSVSDVLCGRWNNAQVTTATFVIDTTPPTTAVNAVLPDPNNGFVSGPGNGSFLNSERIDATFTDPVSGGVSSRIGMAEVFISQPDVLPWCYTGARTPPTTGTACTATPPVGFFGSGAEMVPEGAQWNVSPTQKASAFIPLADVRAFPEGHVWFWIHAMDQAGNWEPFTLAATDTHYSLTLDKTPPTLTPPCTLTPTPQCPGVTVVKGTSNSTLTIHATDPLVNGVNTNIVAAEYFTSPCTIPSATEAVTCFNDPGPGNGTPITVATPGTTVTIVATIPNPPHGQALYVRVKDLAGNWSVVDYRIPVAIY